MWAGMQQALRGQGSAEGTKGCRGYLPAVNCGWPDSQAITAFARLTAKLLTPRPLMPALCCCVAEPQTPMPTEYRDMRVRLLCNDCNTRFETAFHVVGHKCTSCGGYNTRRL